MTRVLVTGGTGFVGRALCDVLVTTGYQVRVALRADHTLPEHVSERVVVGTIGSDTDWSRALRDVELVVHAAARVHIPGDPATNADLYLETNARATKRLAQQAADVGVRRFVFLSSIKVNGEDTPHRPFTAQDIPRPLDPYGQSKWLAERYLQEIAASTGLEAVVVRPPLVYGPEVKANFLRMLQWVDEGRWPLPLGGIDNSRSLVNIWNLCDLLACTLSHAAAPGRVWLVSDGEDLSTPDLIRRIAAHMGRRASLFHVPKPVLKLAGLLTGKQAEVARLCESLQVDIGPTRRELGWTPRVSVDQALAWTCEWYRTQRGRHGGDKTRVD